MAVITGNVTAAQSSASALGFNASRIDGPHLTLLVGMEVGSTATAPSDVPDTNLSRRSVLATEGYPVTADIDDVFTVDANGVATLNSATLAVGVEYIIPYWLGGQSVGLSGFDEEAEPIEYNQLDGDDAAITTGGTVSWQVEFTIRESEDFFMPFVIHGTTNPPSTPLGFKSVGMSIRRLLADLREADVECRLIFRQDQTQAVSVSNPEYVGNVKVLTAPGYVIDSEGDDRPTYPVTLVGQGRLIRNYS